MAQSEAGRGVWQSGLSLLHVARHAEMSALARPRQETLRRYKGVKANVHRITPRIRELHPGRAIAHRPQQSSTVIAHPLQTA